MNNVFPIKEAQQAFNKKQYANVAQLLEPYLTSDPDHIIDRLYTHAKSNVNAGIEFSVPNREDFESCFNPKTLTRGPDIGNPDINIDNAKKTRNGFNLVLHQTGLVLNIILSELASFLFQCATRFAGYIDRKVSTGIWTNWYHGLNMPFKSLDKYLMILRLAYLRETLFDNNLINTYPDSSTGFYNGDEMTPPLWTLLIRTEDGSWNWLPREKPGGKIIRTVSTLHDPMVGASMTRFHRNVGDCVGLDCVRPRDNPAVNPVNVLRISSTLLTRKEFIPVPFLNLIAGTWIQFMIHDWVSHGDNQSKQVDRVPFPENDPRREIYGLEEMLVQKTQADPTYDSTTEQQPHTYINEVTHWWDASQIYGSNRATVQSLRLDYDGNKLEFGKLFLPGEKLPRYDVNGDQNRMERTGYIRNWWLGLSVLHTLFAREHNSICDMLHYHYPKMSSDEIFHKARLINAALIAKIHTVEWTPAILPNEALVDGMFANWYGLLTKIFKKGKHKKTVADINIRNRELGGIVGNAPTKVMSKYALSEEFTAVYRMHSLLPDTLNIKQGKADQKSRNYWLNDVRQCAVTSILDKHDLHDIWSSFGEQHCGALVLHNYPSTLQSLSTNDMPFQDLGAIDIYRDRERGIPNFNQLRRELSLKPINSFNDMSPDQEVGRELREIYGQTNGKDNVEDIDLLIGTLSEGHRPTGFGFGETLFQIFLLNASWRLLGDRFYTDDYRPEIYTEEGMDWIDDSDMKAVLLRHYPELANSNLSNINNAFEPWDKGPLSLDRHPLEAFRE